MDQVGLGNVTQRISDDPSEDLCPISSSKSHVCGPLWPLVLLCMLLLRPQEGGSVRRSAKADSRPGVILIVSSSVSLSWRTCCADTVRTLR